MKEELDIILRHLDHDDDKILELKESILKLDISYPTEIEHKIESLYAFINDPNVKTHDYLGYYYLFLGCVYYEKGEYVNEIDNLEGAILQLWEPVDKAIAYWLLGISYPHLNEINKAREALQDALNTLSTNTNINTRYIQIQNKQRLIIRERITNSLIDIQTSGLHWRQEFSKIIINLQVPEKGDPQIWEEWQDSICDMEPDPIHDSEQITKLTEFLESGNPDYLTEVPFINILLAHCYNLEFFSGNKQSLSFAIEHTAQAIEGFRRSELNQALSHWYAALLYFSISKTLDCQLHLEKADYLLKILIEQTKYKNSKLSIQVKSIKSDIEIWINKFKRTNRTAHYVASKESPKTKKAPSMLFEKKENQTSKINQSTSAPTLTPKGLFEKNPQTPQTSSKSTATNKFRIQHIIIPVDIGALDDLHSKAFPLNYELYEKLKVYNRLDMTSPKNASQVGESKLSIVNHLIIPNIPIYGCVSAGPNGEALLNNSEILGRSSEADENNKVEIEGMKYEINFIDFPVPNFFKGRVYGWLKVTGESMNRAAPYHIMPNDYVLFRENHSFESCVRKIVIALLSEADGQPPRLMVKRLIKMSGETAYQEDGYASELQKFMLHSESSFDCDPTSGINFKKDIEIENDYQLAGEVIAIAKSI